MLWVGLLSAWLVRVATKPCPPPTPFWQPTVQVHELRQRTLEVPDEYFVCLVRATGWLARWLAGRLAGWRPPAMLMRDCSGGFGAPSQQGLCAQLSASRWLVALLAPAQQHAAVLRKQALLCTPSLDLSSRLPLTTRFFPLPPLYRGRWAI